MKDWNINDSKHSGYIQNRSHWKELGKEMTVGGANCGVYRGIEGNQFQGPTIEFLYVDGSQISVQLDATTTIPVYDQTIIEIQYGAPDANGNRTVVSYRPVEIFYDMYCTMAANYLGLGYRNEQMNVYAIQTDSYHPMLSGREMTEIWDSYGIGEVAYQCTQEMGWETLYFPTDEQKVKLQKFLKDHAYGFAGGYVLMDDVPYKAYKETMGTIKIFNPSDTWKTYWPAPALGENEMPIYILSGGSPADGQYKFFAFPAENPLNPNSLTPEMMTKLATTKCGDVGIGTLGKYTPVIYHTIPMELLPQEILNMYAWYQENYDLVTTGGAAEEPIIM